MTERSRLSRKLESQTKKRLVINIIGIVLVLLFLVQFGVPIILGISTLFSGATKGDTSEKRDMFIQPPILDTQPDATNSATISITGRAYEDQKIVLYLNGRKEEETTTDKDGAFTFKHVSLQVGKNSIKTKAIVNKKETGFSNELSIEYKNKPPTLSVDNPKDNQSFGKDDPSTTVTGKTDPGARITVNGLWAIVEDNGEFRYTFRLQHGENKIRIVATDVAENKTEREITVSRAQ